MIKLSTIRPALYIIVLAMALVGAYAFKLRTQGIFACTAEGYRTDRYLGYCNGDAYADYDHGAVWFGLEPDVQSSASAAEVLFLGSSRMEFAFSSIATDEWFAAAKASHYLLGFSHTENQAFAAPLLTKLNPRAKVYVINVENFFSDVETGPASEILHNKEMQRRYEEKRRWQWVHQRLCTRVTAICGHKFAYFRAEKSGHWVVRGDGSFRIKPVADGPDDDLGQLASYAAVAERFVSKLPVDRSCVLLTLVPNTATRTAESRAIARALGMELISPQIDGLQTFDGSHLDRPSSELWSKAFFEAAGTHIHQCLQN